MSDDPEIQRASFTVSTAAFVVLDPCHFGDDERLAKLVQDGKAVLVNTDSDGEYDVALDESDGTIVVLPSTDQVWIVEPKDARTALFLDN